MNQVYAASWVELALARQRRVTAWAPLLALAWPVGTPVVVSGLELHIRVFHILVLLAFFGQKRFPIAGRDLFFFFLLPISILSSSLILGRFDLPVFKATGNGVVFAGLSWLVLTRWRYDDLVEAVIGLWPFIGLASISVLVIYASSCFGFFSPEAIPMTMLDRHQCRLIFPLGDPNFVGLMCLPIFWVFYFKAVGSARLILLPLIGVMVATMSNSLFLSVLVPLILSGEIIRNAIFRRLAIILPWLVVALIVVSKDFYQIVVVFIEKFTYFSERPKLWGYCLKLILAQPWFGYGWSATPGLMVQQMGRAQQAHNVIFDFMLAGGILLTSALFSFFAWIAFKVKRGYVDGESLPWVLALSILMMSLTLSTYYAPQFIFVAIFAVAYARDGTKYLLRVEEKSARD